MTKATWCWAWSLTMFFIAAALASVNVLAKTRLVPLEEYVRGSEVILVGRVSMIEDTKETSLLQPQSEQVFFKKASVQIEVPLLKGNVPGDILQVYFNPKDSVEQKYRLGSRYLFFLYMYEGRWRSFHGYGGSIEVSKNGDLDYVYMTDESRDQRAEDLIKKIRSIINLNRQK